MVLMQEITDVEIKKRLAFDNPWWDEGRIPAEIDDWPRRMYFDGFAHLVQQTEVTRAVVLMGPRRVGKTVMIVQLIQKLINDGVDPKFICSVSVDTPIYTGLRLDQLLTWFMESHGHGRNDPLFVIYDEIQYHPEWEIHLKSLVDSYPAMRFVASGSAAAALKMKSQESGAGRFTDFLLPPLNFAEFLRFRNIEDELIDLKNDTYDTAGFNDAFVDYINYGSFPEAVLKPEIRNAMDRFIANDIVDKVLLRDIPSLYGIHDTQELKRFFTVLAYNSGMEVSFENLAQASGVAKNTLRKYLDYFEAAFLIHRFHRIDRNAKRFKRVTTFKVYLMSPCIRCALFGPIQADDPAMGPMAETVIISQLAQSHWATMSYYARWKTGEVDLVTVTLFDKSELIASEIKWSDRFATRPKELKSLVEFCSNNNIEVAFVFSRNVSGIISFPGVEIYYSPASYMAYSFSLKIQGYLEDLPDPKKFNPEIREIVELIMRDNKKSNPDRSLADLSTTPAAD